MTTETFTKTQLHAAIAKAAFKDEEYSILMDALLDYETVELELLGETRTLKLINESTDDDEITVILQVENDDRFFRFEAHYHPEFGSDWDNMSCQTVKPETVTTTRWIKTD